MAKTMTGNGMADQAAYMAMDFAVPGSGEVARFGTQLFGKGGGGGGQPPMLPKKAPTPFQQPQLNLAGSGQPPQVPQPQAPQSGTGWNMGWQLGGTGAGQMGFDPQQLLQALLMAKR